MIIILDASAAVEVVLGRPFRTNSYGTMNCSGKRSRWPAAVENQHMICFTWLFPGVTMVFY